MTTSIFSKLSQQSKHRDLLENQDPDAPPIGNPKIGKTIAEFRGMNLDVRMACGSCRTSGPLDLSALPKGADTESRLVAARCPSCGSEAVSQEIVPLGSIEGPAFAAFVRVPRVAPPKSSYRPKPPRADILPEDDVPPELLPILNKEIAEDHDLPDGIDSKETEDVETVRPAAPVKATVKATAKPAAPNLPAVKAAPAKAPAKPAGKTAAKGPAKPAPAKTPTKSPAKPAGQAVPRPPAKPAPAKVPTKTPAKPAGKTAAKGPAKPAPAKTPTKAPAKAAGKAAAKAPAKSAPAKTPAKAPAKTLAASAAKTSGKAGAKAPAEPVGKAASKTPAKKGARR